MKRTVNILSLAVAVLAVSCSLDEKMRSQTTPEDYYQTESQCMAGLNACYQPLRNIYNSKDYFQVTEVQTDIMFSKRKDQYNAICQISPSQPQFGAYMWQYGYLGVMRSNAVYAGIERSPLSPSEKAPLLAEAVVLRSMFYYILTSNFGDVPFYTEEVTSENNMRISGMGRMPAAQTRDSLITDLRYWLVEKKALDWAPVNSPANSRQYRCGTALGLYLAGKMCLWNGRWSDAIEYFGYLEDIYGNGAGNPDSALAGYPLSDVAFNRRNTPEVILEISNIAVEYGIQLYGSLASFTTPIRADVSNEGMDDEDAEFETESENDVYDGICIPELGRYARTHVPIRPARRMWKRLMPQDSGDLRCKQYATTVSKAGVPGEVEKLDGCGYMAWGWPGYAPDEDRTASEPKFRLFAQVKTPAYRPYLGNKFWCFGMQSTMDHNSYKAFRFAGAVLGLAEAWFRKGDYDMACRYLNAVKERAGIDLVNPSMYPDPDDLLKEIQDEYARELFGEFQRKHDLVRWGIWYDMVMEHNVSPARNNNMDGGEDNTIMGAYIKPCHEYYPIPDEQITYSRGALDNKEYNRYGL